MKFAIHDIIGKCLDKKFDEDKYDDNGAVVKTSYKLPENMLNFYSDLAREMGTTTTAVIKSVLHIVMQQTLVKSQGNEELTLVTNKINTGLERFFKVFRMHSVPTIMIPEILSDFNITINHINGTQSNLDKIFNNKVLEFVSKIFGVNISWLKGESDSIYSGSYSFNAVEEFKKYIGGSKYPGVFPEVVFLAPSKHTAKIMHIERENDWNTKVGRGVIYDISKHENVDDEMYYPIIMCYRINHYNIRAFPYTAEFNMNSSKDRATLRLIQKLCFDLGLKFTQFEISEKYLESIFDRKILPIRIWGNDASLYKNHDLIRTFEEDSKKGAEHEENFQKLYNEKEIKSFVGDMKVLMGKSEERFF